MGSPCGSAQRSTAALLPERQEPLGSAIEKPAHMMQFTKKAPQLDISELGTVAILDDISAIARGEPDNLAGYIPDLFHGAGKAP